MIPGIESGRIGIEEGKKSPVTEAPEPTLEGVRNPETGKFRVAEYSWFPKTEERGKSFEKKRIEFYNHFLERDPRIIKKLFEGRVVGKGSEGWENVGEHNAEAMLIGYQLAQLVGFDKGKAAFWAGTHDWDKRIHIEKAKIKSTNVNGVILVDWDPAIIAAHEGSRTGPLRATGDDLRDYETWGMLEKILRVTDSMLMDTDDMKHNEVVSAEDRLERLAKRKPEYNKTQGEAIYGKGKLLFTEILRVTNLAEAEIYTAMLAKNPEIAEELIRECPEPRLLYKLVTKLLTDEIDATLTFTEPVTIYEYNPTPQPSVNP